MAGSSVQRIDTAMFDEALNKLTSAINLFESSIDSLESLTTNLFGVWQGKGKDAYSRTYTKLRTSIKDETENLIAIRDDLQSIKESYTEWDTQTGKAIGDSNKGDQSSGRASGGGGKGAIGGGAGGGGVR